MSTEISCFKLKYFNKSLKELNTYSSSPIVYKFNKFSVFYICNDLSFIIFNDNTIGIPGIGYLNMLLCKYWVKHIPYFNLNILDIGDNNIITNFIDNYKIKILVFLENSNLKKLNKIYEFNLNKKNKFSETKKINNFIFNYDYDSNFVLKHEINFLINLTSHLFKKMIDLSNQKNLMLTSSLFEFSRYKKEKKFYLINLPFSFDYSIYNYNEINRFIDNENNRIHLLKIYKQIINTLLNKNDYDVLSYKDINISNTITNYYLKNRNIFILIYDNDTIDILNEFIYKLDEHSLYHLNIKFSKNIKQDIDKYKNINPNILIIVLNNKLDDLYILDDIGITVIKYINNINKSKKYKQLSNIMCLNSINDIINICIEVEKID